MIWRVGQVVKPIQNSPPYYFYIGKSFFSECDGDYYYIIFDKTKSAISMPYRIVQLLQQMINPSSIPIQNNTFYYNDHPYIH